MISDGLKIGKNYSKRMTKNIFSKKDFLDEKLGKNVIFEAKNQKKIDKKVLSWPREMVDSLKIQKKLT